ncbi:MAG: nicotinate-nucleotide adenylyltransferase [Bryobacteraceae bacterium]
MKLALFGGTFDPIHAAHLTVAREAADRFALDRVLFIPNAHPPHKGGTVTADYEDRVRMAELACQEDPRFHVSKLEAGTRKSYSILTIEKVRQTLDVGDELFFLIGSDAFAELRSWYRWRDVIAEVEFIVVTRPGHQYTTPPEARVLRLETLALPVSSSDIRAALARGETPRELPAAVAAYIRERGLYR